VTRRELVALLGGVAASLVGTHTQAQEAKVRRLGFLRVGPPPDAWIDGLRQGLRQHGYIDGQNITIDFGLVSSAAQLPDVP
jgi:putative tryptophan/tyrosine transport system substrate-binding protein